LSEHLAYYSVVRIPRSDRSTALGVDGRIGVVLGVSDSGEHVEYGVLIDDGSYMADSSDLEPTGEVLSREAIYGNSSIAVQPKRFRKGD